MMVLSTTDLEIMYKMNVKETDLYPSWYRDEKYYNCEHFSELFKKSKKKKSKKTK